MIEYDAAARTGCARSRSWPRRRTSSRTRSSGSVRRGGRVGRLVPQSFATAVAHFAIHKAGGVALPLSELFGPDALRHRLADSGARVLIVAAELVESFAELAVELG